MFKHTKMPPRKEAKENVVYAASKRKAPPFKPQRPSRTQTQTTESESSRRPAPARRKSEEESSEEELADDPLAASPEKAKKKVTQPRRRTVARQPSPMDISSAEEEEEEKEEASPAAPASQSDTTPSIPQALLVRLLHEHFADRKTKIDKHAIQVLQKYVEVFVREAIARSALQKREDAEKGGGEDLDVGWLELEDLEKVAAGFMLDF